MGDVIYKKIRILTTAVFGFLLLTAALLCVFRIQALQNTLDINALRTDAMSVVDELERTQSYDASTSFSNAIKYGKKKGK